MSITLRGSHFLVAIVCAICSMADTALAQESIASEDLIARLNARWRTFETYGVEYAGIEIFPVGGLDAQVAIIDSMGEDSGDVDRGPIPRTATSYPIHVEWKIRFPENSSMIDIKRGLFSHVDFELHPQHQRYYFSGGTPMTLWIYRPLEGNPSTVEPIEENTPEYLEKDPSSDVFLSDAIALALVQSTGLVVFPSSNSLLGDRLSVDNLTELRQISSRQVAFKFAIENKGNPQLSVTTEFVCEIMNDGTARVLSSSGFMNGEPMFETSLSYNQAGIAETISVVGFMGYRVRSHGELTLKPKSVTRDVPKVDVTFPGVPVDGVVLSKGKFYYVDSDGERVGFNPRVRRQAPASSQGF